MHPKEAYHQHTGTGRLASLSLVDSEIIVGIDFTQNKRLNLLLSDSVYFPVVLYPADDAFTAQSPQLQVALEPVAGGEKRKLLVIVVDATWFFAKKMLRLSPNVRTLPKLSFQQVYQSEFTFKKQPAEGCVSTIESCYHLIREMQASTLVSPRLDATPLMSVFRRMVDFQLEAEQNRIALGIPGRHSYDAERDVNRKKRKRRQRIES
jgi:DTW domain-containing protein YfiP